MREENSGFRFFRDDRLLREYESRVQCSRCGAFLYPDEVFTSCYCGDLLCFKCDEIIKNRVMCQKARAMKTRRENEK